MLVTCGGWLSSHSTSLSSAYCTVHVMLSFICVLVWSIFEWKRNLYRVVLVICLCMYYRWIWKNKNIILMVEIICNFFKKNKKKLQGISARSEFWKRTIDVRCLLTISLKKNEIWFETLLTCPILSNYLIEISQILFFEKEKNFLYLCLSSYNDKTEFYAMWKSRFLGIMPEISLHKKEKIHCHLRDTS